MRISLIGFGISNRAIMKFILDHKIGEIFVSDKKELSFKDKEELSKLGIDYEENGNTVKAAEADMVVYSPSVRPDDDVLRMARSHGADMMGELEFSWRQSLKSAKVVAVTGSNGKTTTTSLTDHILKVANIDHFTGGNIGIPSIEYGNDPIALLEVSSFQLMGVKNFKPYIGTILNISPNHLNWHKDMEEYISAKMFLSNGDIFLYNADSDFIPPNKGMTVSKNFGNIRVNLDENTFRISDQMYSIQESKLFGHHNLYNAAFAAAICTFLGVKSKFVREGIRTFIPLSHRQENVAEINGIVYINDSKSTTSESTLAALKNFSNSIVIIGGRPKEREYTKLGEAIKEKSKFAIVMGEMVPMMDKQLKSFPHTCVTSLKEAVEVAQDVARSGDIVLFSPAATSFDMFKNYKERGETFKRIVLNAKKCR